MMMETSVVVNLLAGRIHKRDIDKVIVWAVAEIANLDVLYCLTESDNDRTRVNALWCMTHLPVSASGWLQARQDCFINRLLIEVNPSARRLLLQLLRESSFDKDALRTDFLDYCLAKINSQCEPYAVRCNCIYCAYEMCRHYPELLSELKECLAMLDSQPLSPGLASAYRKVMRDVNRSPGAPAK